MEKDCGWVVICVSEMETMQIICYFAAQLLWSDGLLLYGVWYDALCLLVLVCFNVFWRKPTSFRKSVWNVVTCVSVDHMVGKK